MKTTLTISLLVSLVVNSIASSDSYVETLTERLFKGKQGTIFTCKVLSIIPRRYIPEILNNGLIRKGHYEERETLTIQIIDVYFGAVDTSIVTLRTYTSNIQVGKSYLVYTWGNGRTFNCDGGYMKILESPKTINEEFIIKNFSNIYKHKTSGKFTFYNHLNRIVADGEFKKGVPINTWNHYNDSGILKACFDLKNNIETQYYSDDGAYTTNGNKRYTLYEFKNNKIDFGYSYKVSGQLLNMYYFEKLDTNSWIVTHTDFFDNGNVKSVSKYIDMKGNYSGSSDTGKYIECYNNGTDRLIGEYSHNSIRIGKWKWYNDDGTFKTEFDYRDGIENRGEYMNTNFGVYQLKGQLIKDKRVGLWTWYSDYHNRIIKAEFDYKNGIEKQVECNYRNYYNQSNYEIYGQYVNGMRVGLWVWTYYNDIDYNKIENEFDYKDGKVNQIEYKENYENGKIKLLGQCENGNPIGIWAWFDQEGNIVFETDYKSGVNK